LLLFMSFSRVMMNLCRYISTSWLLSFRKFYNLIDYCPMMKLKGRSVTLAVRKI
jgi:hypothetical protein